VGVRHLPSQSRCGVGRSSCGDKERAGLGEGGTTKAPPPPSVCPCPAVTGKRDRSRGGEITDSAVAPEPGVSPRSGLRPRACEPPGLDLRLYGGLTRRVSPHIDVRKSPSAQGAVWRRPVRRKRERTRPVVQRREPPRPAARPSGAFRDDRRCRLRHLPVEGAASSTAGSPLWPRSGRPARHLGAALSFAIFKPARRPHPLQQSPQHLDCVPLPSANRLSTEDRYDLQGRRTNSVRAVRPSRTRYSLGQSVC
jgi:hypothetical protein